MDKTTTPEEKLLKFIEKPSDIAVRPQGEKPDKKGGSFRFNLPFDALKKIIQNKNNLKSLLTFNVANKALTALCIIVTVSWIFDFYQGHAILRQRIEDVQKNIKTTDKKETAKTFEDIKLSEVLEGISARNIFTLSPFKAEASDVSADYNQIVNNLKLVGIMWSENPQAMVETKEGKTYLLNNGDKIDQLTVKKIYKDKVVLNIEEEEWELR